MLAFTTGSVDINENKLTIPYINLTVKKLKYLRVEFEGDIRPHEIPAFRGAVVDKVGLEHDMFHNHDKTAGFIYRYPLIQYKTIRKQASLLCIDFGVEEIHHFFQNKDWTLEISGRQLNMSISRLDMQQYNLQAWDKLFHYNIRNWIALSQDSYRDYQAFENLADRVRFLETKLVGNILSFAKGVDWHVDKQIEAHIKELKEPRWVNLKGKKVLGFNLDFTSNVFLPNYIGLGKSVSLGYGTVVQRKNH